MNLPHLFNIQINHIQSARLLDVQTIDTHKGIGHKLAAVGGDGIAKRGGGHIYRHAALEADAVVVFHLLHCNSE